MACRLSIALRNYMLQDCWFANSSYWFGIYAGTRPVLPSDTPAGTLLMSWNGFKFGTASGGKIVTPANAQQPSFFAAGTATFGRLQTKYADFLDGSVGVAGSGEQFILTTTAIADNTVRLGISTITLPGG